MPSLVETQVRQQLGRYLLGEMPLSAFQRWIVPATWGLDPSADALAADVLLRLAEFSNGDWQEWELRQQFARLLQPKQAISGQVVVQSEAAAWVVRFVPFGSLQAVVTCPAEPGIAEQEEAARWSPAEIIRGTALTHNVLWADVPLQLNY